MGESMILSTREILPANKNSATCRSFCAEILAYCERSGLDSLHRASMDAHSPVQLSRSDIIIFREQLVDRVKHPDSHLSRGVLRLL